MRTQKIQMESINRQLAFKLGCLLKAQREMQKSNLKEIGDALLLSSHQIKAIEAGDVEGFYNARLFAQAAKKYCRLMEIGYPYEILGPASENYDLYQKRYSEIFFSRAQKTVSYVNGSIKNANSYLRLNIKLEGFFGKLATKQFSFMTVGKMVIVAVAAVILTKAFWIKDKFDLVSDYPEKTIEAIKSVEEVALNSDNSGADNAESSATNCSDSNNIKSNCPALENLGDKDQSGLVIGPVASGSLSVSQIEIKFTSATWCQIVYKNGAKNFSHYAQGSAIVVEKNELQAITIGGANTAEIKNSNGFVDTTNNTYDIVVTNEAAKPVTGYLVLRKVAGWATKVETATYGAYDDETRVGASTTISGSPDKV